MIYLGLGLLFISLYTMFLSCDVLDFSRGLMRVLLSAMFLVFERFEDPGVRETAVGMYAVLILVFLAFQRKEVQVNHDDP